MVEAAEGIVDVVVEQHHLCQDAAGPGPAAGWQAYLQRLAHGVRSLAVEDPQVLPLIPTRRAGAWWLCPPLWSVQVVEEFLGTLIDRGFSDERVVAAYRAFFGFVLGQLLLEAGMRKAGAAPAEEPLDEGACDVAHGDRDLDLREYPHLQRLQSPLSEDHTDAEFERGLEDLLDRLDRGTTGR